LNFIYLDDRQGSLQTVGDKRVISGLRWNASERYGLLITVGGLQSNRTNNVSLHQSEHMKMQYRQPIYTL